MSLQQFMKISFDKKLVVIFVAALLSVLISVAIAYNNYRNNLQNNLLVSQTSGVIHQSAQILFTLQQAENSARGFFISGDSTLLTSLSEAGSGLQHSASKLKELTAGNIVLAQMADSIAVLGTQSLELENALIRSRRPGTAATGAQLQVIKQEDACMKRIRATDNNIADIQSKVVMEKKRQNATTLNSSGNVFITMLCILAALVIVSIFIIYNYLSLAKKEVRQIKLFQNNILQKLKAGNEKLVLTEIQYKSLFENMLSGFAYCEAIYEGNNIVDFTYLSANKAYEDFTGLGSVAGKKITELLPEVRIVEQELFEKIGKVLADGKTEHMEVYVKSLDRWLAITLYSSVKGYFVVLVNNISAYKNAEEKIARSEKRSRALIENNYDLISLLDETFTLFYRSPSAERITGWSNKEMIGTKGTDHIHPGDISRAEQLITKMMKFPATPVPVLIRSKHKLGHYIWLEGVITNQLYDKDINAVIFNFRDVTERIEAEKKIKQSEDNLRVIFENTSEAFLLIDKQCLVKAFNSRANEFSLFNSKNQMVEGESIYNFVAPERVPIIRPMIESVLQGKSFQYDRLYKKDAEDVWINFSFNPVFSNGVVEGICLTASDISKRMETERKLQQAHDQLFFHMENSPLGFIEWNVDMTAAYFSKRAEHILGWNEKEFLIEQAKGTLIVFEEDKRRADQMAENLLSGQIKRNQVQYRIYHKNGRVIWCEWFNSVMRDENGKVVTIMSLVRDITQQKNTEEQIRISNERFQTLSQVTKDPVWDWNLLTDEVFWNESFFNMLGYDTSKPVPLLETWSQRIHPADREKVMSRLSRIRKNEVDNWQDEFRFEQPDGHFGTVIDRAQVIRDDFKSPVRVIGTFVDITKRKKEEQQLLEMNEELNARAGALIASNAELEQFAYIASHDLQEPLRMVTSFLSLLQKKYKHQLDETAVKYIAFAVDGAERMRKMILDLLEYSRAGKKEYDPNPVNLNELIAAIIQLNSVLMHEKKAIIEYSELPEIRIVKTPVQQVFQNLIANALKYQHPEKTPHIKISAYKREKHWEFCVADNGLGIQPEFFEKIFVLFQRLHSHEKFSGTGMGLAICKKIVENFNGRIWVESLPGEGSAFYFTIPHDCSAGTINNYIN